MIKNNKLYSWTGKNKQGETVLGKHFSHDIDNLRNILFKKNIFLIKAKKETGYFWSKKINAQDITHFTRQIATLFKTGVPLVTALHLISQNSEKIAMQCLIENIKQEVESGMSITNTLKKYPDYFDKFYCEMMAMGEMSGTLEMLLDRLVIYREKKNAIKAQLKKACSYPITVLIIAILMTAALLIFVIPQFELLYDSFGASLPEITRIVITISKFLQQQFSFVLLIILLIVIIMKFSWKHSPILKVFFENSLLKIPFIGSLCKKTILVKLTRSLSTLLSAGIPILSAIKTVSDTLENNYYQKIMAKILKKISMGESFQQALSQVNVFPTLVIQMVGIGETSGTLEMMLEKIATIYEEEVERTLSYLNLFIEPLMMTLLGVMVGILIIAMYLPMFRLGSIL